MNQESELIAYLHAQFPSTVGHIPLKRKIRAVLTHGMTLAAEVVDKRLLKIQRRPWTIDAQDTHREIIAARDRLTAERLKPDEK